MSAFSRPNGSFRHRTYSEKDGYPSQNDFALSISMARFGIEGLMQKGWSVQKTTLSSLPMAHFGLELIAKRTDTFLKTTSGPALAR